VLEEFLGRAAIYATKPMRELEPRARANITAELASLRG
jgi:predicted metal-dependent HD superfamily phosphohydrolase